jgi:hypothetical protein
VLSYIDKKKQDVRKELTEKSNEIQMDLQATRMYTDKQVKNILEAIADTNEGLHERCPR